MDTLGSIHASAARTVGIIDGYTITAHLLDDPDAYSIDADELEANGGWATQADQDAFANGDWEYATLRITASRDGYVLGDDYLSGIIVGTLGNGNHCDGWDYATLTDDYSLIDGALTEARATLHRLIRHDQPTTEVTA